MNIIYEKKEQPLIGYIENHNSWDMNDAHFHNTWEFYLLTSGDKKMVVNGQEYVMHPQDIAIIKPYTVHYSRKGKSECISRYIINFSNEQLIEVFSENEVECLFNNLKSCIIHLNNEQLKKIIMFWEIIKENSEPIEQRLIKHKIASCNVAQMIMYLKSISNKNEKTFEDDNSLTQSIIDSLEYIHNNYKNPFFGLEEALEEAHMSKCNFCKNFKGTLGITFLSYLNELRVNNIKKVLLQDTKTSLDVVAYNNGFITKQSMVRNFKKHFGVTPAQYRKGNGQFN